MSKKRNGRQTVPNRTGNRTLAFWPACLLFFLPMCLLLCAPGGPGGFRVLAEGTGGTGRDVSGSDVISVSDNASHSGDEYGEQNSQSQKAPEPESQMQETTEPDSRQQASPKQRTGAVLQVVAPSAARLMLDPYRIAGGDQIYSEDITIENQGSCAVEVLLERVECSLPQEKNKSCELYLYRRDSDTSFKLTEEGGKYGDSFALPAGGTAVYYFNGSMKEGSEALWKEADVRLKLVFSFREA